MIHDLTEANANNRVDITPSFVEHHVPREKRKVFARDYKGDGPDFGLMHGFPDNLHFYDELIPTWSPAGGGSLRSIS